MENPTKKTRVVEPFVGGKITEKNGGVPARHVGNYRVGWFESNQLSNHYRAYENKKANWTIGQTCGEFMESQLNWHVLSLEIEFQC